MNLGTRPDRAVIFRAAADAGAVFAAFFLVYASYLLVLEQGWIENTVPNPEIYGWLPVLFSVLCIGVFTHLHLYRPFSGLLNLWELKTATKGLLVTAGFFYAALFVLKVPDPSRYVVLGSTVAASLLVLVGRRFTAALLLRQSLRGRGGKETVIVGAGPCARLLYKKIVNAPHLRRTVVGFLDSRRPKGSRITARVAGGSGHISSEVLGHPRELESIVKRSGVQEVLIDSASLHPAELERVLEAARISGLMVGIVPSIGPVGADQYEIVDLSALPLLRPLQVAGGPVYRFLKRTLDILGSSVLLVLTAPLWPVIAFAVRVSSRGPAFFKQRRVGRNGAEFEILKFRSMKDGANPYAHSPERGTDARVTSVGRVIRKLGLDELPQLINVLRGDMSMVGPRPEMPFIVEHYSDVERKRLAVRPGITGPWQLSPDREAQIHENLEYDLYYVSHRSTLLDLVILFETVLYTVAQLLPRVSPLGNPTPRPSVPISGKAAPTYPNLVTGSGVGFGDSLPAPRSMGGDPREEQAWQAPDWG